MAFYVPTGIRAYLNLGLPKGYSCSASPSLEFRETIKPRLEPDMLSQPDKQQQHPNGLHFSTVPYFLFQVTGHRLFVAVYVSLITCDRRLVSGDL
jgi:hypothetical protein